MNGRGFFNNFRLRKPLAVKLGPLCRTSDLGIVVPYELTFFKKIFFDSF